MEAKNELQPPDISKKIVQAPLSGPRFHSEHLLEAQELPRLPFTSSRLGRLPAEVREMVYSSVMKVGPTLWGKKPDWLKDFSPATGALSAVLPSQFGTCQKPRLAFLFTCRQIYQEMWRLYYGAEIFSFRKAKPMVGLLTELGWAARHELQIIRVHLSDPRCFGAIYYEGRALWEALDCLSQCRHLRKLEIATYGGWPEEPRVFAKFMLPLRQLKDVEVSVKMKEGVRWKKWKYYDSEQGDWVPAGEQRRWRLVRSGDGAMLQLEGGDVEDGGSWEEIKMAC